MLAHACNPSTLGGQGRQIAWAQLFDTNLCNVVKPSLYKKYKRISQVWWQAFVASATLEAEVDFRWSWGWLEPRRQRLQWVKIISLHSSMGDKARPFLKTQQQQKNRKIELQNLKVLCIKVHNQKRESWAWWHVSVVTATWEAEAGCWGGRIT